MLSRVAEHIYWLARYVERAENTARLMNVNSHLLLDIPRRMRLGWEPIIDILGARELFFTLNDSTEDRQVLRFVISDLHNPGSILSVLQLARENARTIRDIIPREAWEQVNDLYQQASRNSQSGLSPRKRYDYLHRIILGSQTLTGLLSGTMTHDEGYDFLRMGRNLERADMTTRIIDVRSANLLPERSEAGSSPVESGQPFENIQWMSVLKSLTAYQMYRRAVQVRVRRPDVLRFLLQDLRFPRAFRHSVSEVENCLENLPHNEKPRKAVARIMNKVMRAKPEDLAQAELHEFIDQLQLGLARVHDAIAGAYFQARREASTAST
jgi:uncharacterized alpha-E superfamily protein